MLGPMTIGALSSGAAAAFAPTDLAGLALWLAPRLETVYSDGDPIAPLSDNSGQGNDFTTADLDTTKPIYKTGIVNGQQVARYDGGDRLKLASSMGFGGEDKPHTFYAVIKTDNAAANSNILAMASSSSSTPFYRWTIASSGNFAFSIRDDVSAAAAATTAIGSIGTVDFYVLTSLYSGSVVNMRINGSASGGADQALDVGVSTVDQTALGALWRTAASYAEHFDGDIAEVLLYDSMHAQSNYEQVETYLAEIYGISLPF